jgi:hypothetical protein
MQRITPSTFMDDPEIIFFMPNPLRKFIDGLLATGIRATISSNNFEFDLIINPYQRFL